MFSPSPSHAPSSSTRSVPDTTLDRWQYEEVRATALEDARKANLDERGQESLAYARVHQETSLQRKHLFNILAGSLPPPTAVQLHNSPSSLSSSVSTRMPCTPRTPLVKLPANGNSLDWLSECPRPLNAPTVSNKWDVRWYGPSTNEERWAGALKGLDKHTTVFWSSPQLVKSSSDGSDFEDDDCDDFEWPSIDKAVLATDTADLSVMPSPDHLRTLTARTGIDYAEGIVPARAPSYKGTDAEFYAAFFGKATTYAAAKGLETSVHDMAWSESLGLTNSVW